MAKTRQKATATQALKPTDFVNLHLHSHYSLLDGLSKIPAMLDRVKSFGMTSVALTDHGTMSGVIEFYQECRCRDLKPIVGIEVYLAKRSHLDKEGESDRTMTHLILLAQNKQGYQNLMQLSTTSYLKGFYYKPRIDKKLLAEYKEGIIVLSGCMGGEIGEALQAGQLAQAEEIALWYKEVFADNFYLEIQDHSHLNKTQKDLNNQILKMAKKLKIEPVLTTDSHYLTHADKEAHEVLLSIQTKRFMDDPTRMSLEDYDLSLSDPQTIIERWQAVCPEAIVNTKKIADKCDLEIEFDRTLLPAFDLPANVKSADYLRKLVFEGLLVRYEGFTHEEAQKLSMAAMRKKLSKEVIERADYELGVIGRMDFNGYFLIVWDFCRWGKRQNIFFGPGRGSAAASIVAYSLDITTIDPLKYDLLFERFLNPQRVSLPDMDIDIEDGRRDEVIQYVTQKYGADRVANIVTFGTMAARNAVRDVARVLRMSYVQADQLAKTLPPPVAGRSIALKSSIKDDEGVRRQYNADPSNKKVFDLAIQLEGTIRSHGVHAAGVVIAPEEIVNFTPLELTAKGVVTTQYSMKPIEQIGLLKMDFLGIANLTTIKNTLRIVRKVYGQDIDLHNLDLEDRKTYKLLSQADTIGVFQLEGRGMRQYLQRLNPRHFEDIAAMVAIYRPGPLSTGLVDQFIERHAGREKIDFIDPLLEKILKNTYGVMVYQEQVMQISRDVCGFTGLEADELRKAIGKKDRKIMSQLEKRFIDGGVKNKINKKKMEGLWHDIVGFADYAFNRAHSVSYGLIAYQMAYLKAHFRAAFMAALMTSSAGNTDRLKVEVLECGANGIQVLPPDINESFPEFAIVPEPDKKEIKRIRFGLDAIKNVSSKAVQHLVEERTANGPFRDLADFIKRQKENDSLNRKTIESLIKAGAFDCFHEREVMLANLEHLMGALHFANKKIDKHQINLLDMTDTHSLNLTDFGFREDNIPTIKLIDKLDWERELLGIYVSQHPLDLYQDILRKFEPHPLADLNDEVETVADGTKRRVVGIVSGLKSVVAKISRRRMAIIEFEDKSSALELVISPAMLERHQHCWAEGVILALTLQAQAFDYQGNALAQPNWSIASVQKLEIPR